MRRTPAQDHVKPDKGKSTPDKGSSRERRLVRLGQAIRVARGALPQGKLGARIGDVPQTTISRWERGLVDLTVEQVRTIEEALDLPSGALLVASGYVANRISEADLDAVLGEAPLT